MQNLVLPKTGIIAVVDDDDLFKSILFKVIRNSGVTNEILDFESGDQFLEYMLDDQNSHGKYPTITLMDINMPGRSGIETIIALRKDERFVEIPIIVMLTSSSDARDIENSFKAGAKYYIEKPSSVRELTIIQR